MSLVSYVGQESSTALCIAAGFSSSMAKTGTPSHIGIRVATAGYAPRRWRAARAPRGKQFTELREPRMFTSLRVKSKSVQRDVIPSASPTMTTRATRRDQIDGGLDGLRRCRSASMTTSAPSLLVWLSTVASSLSSACMVSAPEFAGEGEAIVVDVSDDHARAALFGDFENGEADGPGAKNEAIFAGLHVAAPAGMDADGQRLGEGSGHGVESCRDAVNVLFRRQTKFREAARPVQSDQAEIHAAVRFAVPAGIAAPATDDRFDDDKIAALDTVSPRRQLR